MIAAAALKQAGEMMMMLFILINSQIEQSTLPFYLCGNGRWMEIKRKYYII